MNYYETQFKNNNYRVLKIPYKPYDAPLFTEFVEDGKKHKDCFYSQKHVYPSYDIVISNMLNKVDLMIMEPNLIK